jgi:hypothetical protein
VKCCQACAYHCCALQFLLKKPYAKLRANDTYIRVDKGDNQQLAVHDGIYDVYLTDKVTGKVSAVGESAAM